MVKRIKEIDMVLRNDDQTVTIFGRTGKTHYMNIHNYQTGKIIKGASFKDDNKTQNMLPKISYDIAVSTTQMMDLFEEITKNLE
jgi:hypothetical protein